MRLLDRYRSLVAKLDRTLSPVALLATRVAFGQSFALTGFGKLHHLDKVTGYFSSLGIPLAAWNAPFVAGLEFGGGILLVLGLATRPIATLLAIDMVVALVTADLSSFGDAFTFDGGFADVTPLPFLLAMLWLVAKGGGGLSLDRLIGRRGAAPGVGA